MSIEYRRFLAYTVHIFLPFVFDECFVPTIFILHDVTSNWLFTDETPQRNVQCSLMPNVSNKDHVIESSANVIRSLVTSQSG